MDIGRGICRRTEQTKRVNKQSGGNAVWPHGLYFPDYKWGVQMFSEDKRQLTCVVWCDPDLLQNMIQPMMLLDDMAKKLFAAFPR